MWLYGVCWWLEWAEVIHSDIFGATSEVQVELKSSKAKFDVYKSTLSVPLL